MKKNTCHCPSGCQTRRCACLKAGKQCKASCLCMNCKNPFNQIEDPKRLTVCARGHIKKIISLSEKDLSHLYHLLCDCRESASLKELLESYECPRCHEVYYYSFCMNEVVHSFSMWHCQVCSTCREDSEWHCKHCNDCTYGLSLECENCGRKSPYM
jgi:hypothetical protein